MDDVMEHDNVGMLQVLQERHLPDGGAGSPFFMFQSYLLQGHEFTSDTEGTKKLNI